MTDDKVFLPDCQYFPISNLSAELYSALEPSIHRIPLTDRVFFIKVSFSYEIFHDYI